MSHTASANGAKHNYERPEVMVLVRFWEHKPESKSEDLDLSPALYSYKISEYESRFGLAVQFKRKGSRGFENQVMDELKMRGLI